MKKRVLPILLCLVLIIALLPATAVPVSAAESWLWPADGCYVISSNFGHRAWTDQYGYHEDNHGGIDIIGASKTAGMPVRATKSGTIYEGCNTIADNTHIENSCGNYACIDHGDGTFSIYMHMQPGNRISGSISQGDTIGYIGNTGDSGGYHLHFELFTDRYNRKGSRMNPMPTNSNITVNNIATYQVPAGWPTEKITYIFEVAGSETGASTLSINPTTIPSGNLMPGKAFGLYGTVSSNYKVTYFEGSIIKASGEVQQTASCRPNAYSVDIRSSAVNQNLVFNSYPNGKYKLHYYAEDASGNKVSWDSDWFWIGDTPAASVVKVVDCRRNVQLPERVINVYSNPTDTTRLSYFDYGPYVGCPSYAEMSDGSVMYTTTATHQGASVQVWFKLESDMEVTVKHTYGDVQYEYAHPHAAYKTCACGEVKYTGAYGSRSDCTTCHPATITGTCGDNLTWEFNPNTGKLTISGTGAMTDYSYNGKSDAPWCSYRESINSVSIGNGVTRIGDDAFINCKKLTSITISDSVTSIGSSAFYNTAFYDDASNWTGGVLYIGKNLICANSDIASICSIKAGTRVIADGAFYECTKLIGVRIPDSVKSIGEVAFANCISLEGVTIPGNVTSIGDYAFRECFALKSILVDNSNPNYCCDSSGVLFNKNKTVLIQAPGAIAGSYSIPASVKTIGGFAFLECENLTGITIPNGVTSISFQAFRSCYGLTTVAIPSSVTLIDDGAFYNCTGLTSFTIPDSVTNLGGAVFMACIALKSVTIGNGVTAILDSNFSRCEALTSVTIPRSVKSIGTSAFHRCPVLKDVYYAGTSAEWNAISIASSNEPLTQATIHFEAHTHNYVNGVCTGCGAKDPNYTPVNPTPSGFNDVAASAWYYEAVNYAVSHSLMNGVGNGRFAPDDPMTRAMLVTVLWRYEGSPTQGSNSFSDISAGQWYTQAVAWAASNGIVGGVGNNRFAPNGNITREQMAAILYRYAQRKGYSTGSRGSLSGFPDQNRVSDYARDAISWAVGSGIIGGSNGQLLPQGNATRAQVSAILMRFIENIASAAPTCKHSWQAATCFTPKYCTKCGATEGKKLTHKPSGDSRKCVYCGYQILDGKAVIYVFSQDYEPGGGSSVGFFEDHTYRVVAGGDGGLGVNPDGTVSPLDSDRDPNAVAICKGTWYQDGSYIVCTDTTTNNTKTCRVLVNTTQDPTLFVFDLG